MYRTSRFESFTTVRQEAIHVGHLVKVDYKRPVDATQIRYVFAVKSRNNKSIVIVRSEPANIIEQ